jgi:hypothetical protein
VYEGQEVAWTGPEQQGLVSGDCAQLLAFSGRASAHVLWTTGSRAGDTDLVDLLDLSTSSSLVEDSLEVGGLQTFAARQVYDSQGEAGVLNAMSSLGHLTAFPRIAEEALALVSSQIRMDPSFRAVTGQLDYDEAEAVVRLASVCLVRDAFGSVEE